MRLWFSRRKPKADASGSARQRLAAARGGPARVKKRSGPPPADPFKNWESEDQAFLRQSGDPSL
jgi:hypothetical protein